MAGGIFTGKPFELNIKCVIISIIGILLFLLPGFQIYEEGNIWSMIIIIMLLFIVLYVAIAYYDYIYDCNPKLKRGYYSITGAFKPPNTEPTTCEQSLKDEHNTLRSIHLMHLFIVAPMLTYAGIIGYKHVTGKSTINTNLSSQLFTVLAATGGVTALYHGYRFINPRL